MFVETYLATLKYTLCIFLRAESSGDNYAIVSALKTQNCPVVRETSTSLNCDESLHQRSEVSHWASTK
jgi:hypothetical protein